MSVARNRPRQYLILHGWQNRRPIGHWQRWLAARLRRAGEQVVYPQLPNPDAPVLDEWLELLHCELELAAEATDGSERIVVCHSLSCLLWLHATDRLSQREVVDRLLLVAPPGPSAFVAETATFHPRAFDAAAVHASSRTMPRLVCSDDDPYCPEQAPELYGKPLSLDVTVLPGAGHLNPAAGYGPWPAALAWCLDANGPVAR